MSVTSGNYSNDILTKQYSLFCECCDCWSRLTVVSSVTGWLMWVYGCLQVMD